MKILTVLKDVSGAPGEFCLLPHGRIDMESEEPAYLDEAGMDAIVQDFERRGNDMVIDYEHQTLKDVQAPAAGWIKQLVNNGKDGLWAVVEWTQRAKGYLSKREYRYHSPVFLYRKSDRKVVKMLNAALTNYPKMNNLTPIVAKHDLSGVDETAISVARQMGVSEADMIQTCAAEKSGGGSGLSMETVFEAAKALGVSKEDLLQTCALTDGLPPGA